MPMMVSKKSLERRRLVGYC